MASKQKSTYKAAEELFAAAKKDFLELQKAQSLAEHALKMKFMREENELKQIAIREDIRASQLKAEYYATKIGQITKQLPFQNYPSQSATTSDSSVIRHYQNL